MTKEEAQELRDAIEAIDVEVLRLTVEKDRIRERRLGHLKYVIFGIGLILVLIVATVVIAGDNNQARSNQSSIDVLTRNVTELTRTVGRLTDQLADAQALIASENAEDEARLQCRDAFETKVRGTNLETIAAIGDLVVGLASTPPAPAPERLDAIGVLIDKLNARVADYHTAADLQAKWIADDRPLPCPLPT